MVTTGTIKITDETPELSVITMELDDMVSIVITVM